MSSAGWPRVQSCSLRWIRVVLRRPGPWLGFVLSGKLRHNVAGATISVLITTRSGVFPYE